MRISDWSSDVCSSDLIKDHIVEKLQAVPLQDLIKASAKAGLLAYMPAVDGKTLPTNPFDPVASPVSADVPIMVGSTKDEATNVFLSDPTRSEEHTSELQSLMRISYAVFCLKKKKKIN